MKPTFQTSRPARNTESQRSFGHTFVKSPATDWSFQASVPDLRGGATLHQGGEAAHAFRNLSRGFFDAESKRRYRAEAGAFVVIIALAVWPIVMAAQAALALAK